MKAVVFLFLWIPCAFGTQSAREFLDSSIRELQKELRNTSSREEVKEIARRAIKEHFAVQKAARIAAGRYWRKATEEEKREYYSLFSEYLLVAYFQFFYQYIKQAEWKLSRERKLKKNRFMVLSQATLKGQKYSVNYYLQSVGSSYQLLDISVEGISVLLNLRDQFASIVRRRKNGFSGLLALMREKLESSP